MLDKRGRDQAEGLRRLLGGQQQPRRLAVLSAVTPGQKNAVLLNLAAALVNAGSAVQLLDASQNSTGIAAHAHPALSACLWSVAQQDRGHEQAVREQAQGVRLARLSRQPLHGKPDAELEKLSLLLRMLRPESNFWLIDIDLAQDDPFVLPEIAQSELIVLTSAAPASIKQAYGQIKMLQARLGQRPVYLLVVGTSAQQADLIQQNMAQASSRYLAITLTSLGNVPADEQLAQAESVGRAILDSNPVAEASVAFRKMAAQLISNAQGRPDFSAAGLGATLKA